MKKLSHVYGGAAWSVAEKHSSIVFPVFFKYSGKLIAHHKEWYSEGKYGEYGFCSDAAKAAWTEGGIWKDENVLGDEE